MPIIHPLALLRLFEGIEEAEPLAPILRPLTQLHRPILAGAGAQLVKGETNPIKIGLFMPRIIFNMTAYVVTAPPGQRAQRRAEVSALMTVGVVSQFLPPAMSGAVQVLIAEYVNAEYSKCINPKHPAYRALFNKSWIMSVCGWNEAEVYPERYPFNTWKADGSDGLAFISTGTLGVHSKLIIAKYCVQGTILMISLGGLNYIIFHSTYKYCLEHEIIVESGKFVLELFDDVHKYNKERFYGV